MGNWMGNGSSSEVTARKDLLLVAVVTLVIFAASVIFEVVEDLIEWILKIDPQFSGFESIEIMVLFMIVSLGASFFGVRRWRALIGEIAERKRIAALWRKESEELAITLNSIGDGVIATDSAGLVTMINPVAESLTGWNKATALNRPLTEIFNIVNEYTREPVENPVAKVLRLGKICGLANHTVLIARNGTEKAIADSAAPIRDEDGKDLGVIMVFRDVTEKRHYEKELKENEEKFRELFDNANDIIFLYELEPGNEMPGRLLEVNRIASTKLGYSKEELLKLPHQGLDDRRGDLKFKKIWNQLVSSGHVVFETNLRAKLGQKIPVEIGSHLFTIKEQPVILSIARDITERKQNEEQLKYIGLHDSLTKLYNRNHFEQEMARLDHSRHLPVAIIMCDVDGLKLVNDTMGHNSGDQLLMVVAELIWSIFNKNRTVVARVGGDEFAVLLHNATLETVGESCRQFKNSIAQYNNDHPELPISISSGFAISDHTGANLLELFKEADNNMYREKLYRSQSARSAIVQTLMKALEARDFITEGHADSLQALVVEIATAIGLPERRVTDLRLLAQFHDIGKVGIPDRVLFKPGEFNPEEYNEMRRHSEIGHRIALSAPDLVPIADWILKHHEWWNGNGYPLGLKQEEIPLECRILAIADAYDAMTHNRPYRQAMSAGGARQELLRCKGTQFDPELVEEFIIILEESQDSV